MTGIRFYFYSVYYTTVSQNLEECEHRESTRYDRVIQRVPVKSLVLPIYARYTSLTQSSYTNVRYNCVVHALQFSIQPDT